MSPYHPLHFGKPVGPHQPATVRGGHELGVHAVSVQQAFALGEHLVPLIGGEDAGVADRVVRIP